MLEYLVKFIIPFLFFPIIPLFQYPIIPSFLLSIIPFFSIIPVERCPPTGHLFAFVEVIQSILTIGFQPCNGARLTLHILPSIFGLLACSFHSRNGIPHMNQEQYSNGSDIPSSSFGSNLFTLLNKYFPALISVPYLNGEY